MTDKESVIESAVTEAGRDQSSPGLNKTSSHIEPMAESSVQLK